MGRIKGFVCLIFVFCGCVTLHNNESVCCAQTINDGMEYQTSLDRYNDVAIQIKENGKYKITISYESTSPEMDSEPLTFFVYDKNENDIGGDICVDINEISDDVYTLEKGKYYVSVKEDLYDIDKAASLNITIKLEKKNSKRVPHKKASELLEKYKNKYTHFKKSKKKVYLIQDGIESDVSYDEDGYSMMLIAYPYIRSHPQGKNSYLTYSIEGTLYWVGYESQDDLDVDCLTIGNSNSKMKFKDITVKEKNRFNYKYLLYDDECKWKCTIFKSYGSNNRDINKLIRILESKKVYIRVDGSNGAWYKTELNNETRKQWLYGVKCYKKMFNKYQ